MSDGYFPHWAMSPLWRDHLAAMALEANLLRALAAQQDGNNPPLAKIVDDVDAALARIVSGR